MNEQLTLVKILRTRYVEMQTRNPSYSIRAYAKKLGMGVSTLSMVLNGQRRCSQKLATQIADRLMLDPIERATILEKFKPKAEKESFQNVIQYLKVSADQYVAFSEWHYMAILNLVRLKSFKNDPKWIAARVGITVPQVNEAMNRLVRLGMLVENDGKLSRSQPAFRTTDDVVDVSVRKGHFQHLELAKKSLEQDSLDERDFSWLTMTVRKSRMKEMKEFVRQFQNEFLERFAKDVDADEVYRLAVQVIPLSKTNPPTTPKKRK